MAKTPDPISMVCNQLLIFFNQVLTNIFTNILTYRHSYL